MKTTHIVRQHQAEIMGVQIQASVEALVAGAGSKMETKLIATMILGVALVLATATAVYTQSALAHPKGGTGVGGDSGVTDGQTAHGLATACSHSNVADHNPNCGSSPTGAAVVGNNNQNIH